MIQLRFQKLLIEMSHANTSNGWFLIAIAVTFCVGAINYAVFLIHTEDHCAFSTYFWNESCRNRIILTTWTAYWALQACSMPVPQHWSPQGCVCAISGALSSKAVILLTSALVWPIFRGAFWRQSSLDVTSKKNDSMFALITIISFLCTLPWNCPAVTLAMFGWSSGLVDCACHFQASFAGQEGRKSPDLHRYSWTNTAQWYIFIKI